jgi:hypothetical protein
MNEWNPQGCQKNGGWKGEKDETGSLAGVERRDMHFRADGLAFDRVIILG